MRKVYLISSISILLIISLFIMLNIYSDKVEEEIVYSIKSYYSYMVYEEASLEIKIYSNDEQSLLHYANEAITSLCDKKRDNIIIVEVINVYIGDSTLYKKNIFYEYIVDIQIKTNKLILEECYLNISFPNQEYNLLIGKIEISPRKTDKTFNLFTNLYGTSDENISLRGIVFSVINNSNIAFLLFFFSI